MIFETKKGGGGGHKGTSDLGYLLCASADLAWSRSMEDQHKCPTKSTGTNFRVGLVFGVWCLDKGLGSEVWRAGAG